MTQDDLAAAAGMSTDLVRKLEQGRRHTASITSLHRIAAALDVGLGELFGRQRMPEAVPDAGVVALRHAVADAGDLLGDVEGEPLSLREAERSVTYLWGAYWAGKYLLLTAEGMSPDWIRHQTLVRAVIQDLLAKERRRSTPLRDLASRVGVPR